MERKQRMTRLKWQALHQFVNHLVWLLIRWHHFSRGQSSFPHGKLCQSAEFNFCVFARDLQWTCSRSLLTWRQSNISHLASGRGFLCLKQQLISPLCHPTTQCFTVRTLFLCWRLHGNIHYPKQLSFSFISEKGDSQNVYVCINERQY